MSNVLSYHNDPAVKAWHVEQAKKHLAADMLRAGTFGETYGGQFRGCSVGCFAHDIDPDAGEYHAIVAGKAGWPEWLVRLNDTLFEGLPEGEREAFHVELRERVPVGVDLEPVRHKIAIARIDRLLDAQRKALAANEGDARDAIAGVIDAMTTVRRCHEAEIGGNACAWSAWSAARSAAASAAESAAESAWLAAELAAWSAESAARSAAWSAASAARSAAYQAERDALYAALAESQP